MPQEGVPTGPVGAADNGASRRDRPGQLAVAWLTRAGRPASAAGTADPADNHAQEPGPGDPGG